MPRLTDAQLAARAGGMGASDVVEALGLAPWQGAGPMRLWLAKTGQTPETEEDPAKLAYLDWGHVQEEALLAWYERNQGVQLLPGGHVPHREIPYLWATLDGKAPDRIVEAKHVGPAMARHWDESAEDGLPRYVRAQCLVGQACLGVRLTDVVASVGGRPPHVWTVGWDEEVAELLLAGAARFWQLVQDRTPPPLDATEATREMLRRRWPSNEDKVILPASPEADAIAQTRIAAALEERQAETAKILADSALLALIGAHDGIASQDGEWKMTWRMDKNGKRRQRFTALALRDEP